MKISSKSVLSAAQRKPLAACCAVMFALAAPEAVASSWIVTSCADDGSSGTLRSVVGAGSTLSGDTIDMTGLQCAQISLTTGAVVVTQASLTLQGPGSDRMPIESFIVEDSVFDHEGTGILFINDLYLKQGTGHPRGGGSGNGRAGGCIYSHGSVALQRSKVYGCSAYDSSGLIAMGGGIFAQGNVFLSNSIISGNYAGVSSSGTGSAFGGGVEAYGTFVAKYSTISGNIVSAPGSGAEGGGIAASMINAGASTTITGSTIYGNYSSYFGGGVVLLALTPGYQATITNSTISGNSAPKVGGLYSDVNTTIGNSTIAFNHKRAQSGFSSGATFGAPHGPITVNLHSNLIANNTYTLSGVTKNNDLSLGQTTATNAVAFSTDAQQGNFNLIRALDASVTAASPPPDTIVGVCPLLGPLKNNGGPTQTHALYSGSPAIDAGVNNAGLYYDQRSGPEPPPNPLPPPPLAYTRHSGVRTDIGAYEVQQTDIIFNSSFESCT